MAWLYSAGAVSSAGIGFIISMNLYKLLNGKLTVSDLVQTSDSEELGADGNHEAATANSAIKV
jgi:TRAP-type C4-dicarboxylate transport system permease small subunit